MINQQLKIIKEINSIINLKPAGYYNDHPLPFDVYYLLSDLGKLGTAPHIAEAERFRKLYLAALSKRIPNLNELEKKYEKQ